MNKLMQYVLILLGISFLGACNNKDSKLSEGGITATESSSPYKPGMTLEEATIITAALPSAPISSGDTSVQPAVFSPSFNCAKASIDAERLICSNQELAALDVDLMAVYKEFANDYSHDKDEKNTLKKEQNDWMKNERNICSTSDCMAKAYRSRIEDLESMMRYLSKPAEFR